MNHREEHPGDVLDYELIDLSYRERFQSRRVVLGVLLGFIPVMVLLIVVAWLATSLSRTQSFIVWPLVVAFVVLMWFVVGRIRMQERAARFQAVFGTPKDTEIETGLRDLLNPTRVNVPSELPFVTTALVGGGISNVIIRLARKATPVIPSRVPFEPLPLDETHPSIEELAKSGDLRIKVEGVDVQDPPDGAIKSLLREWDRRTWGAGGRTMGTLSLLIVLYVAVRGIVYRDFRVWDLWIVFPILGFLNPRGSIFGAPVYQWLIVPGGIVARRPPRRGCSTIHLFKRYDCVLSLLQDAENHWHVNAADSETNDSATITETESIALLRAWLSPLEPPPVERLQELAGE